MATPSSLPPPVRIYILWHPGLDQREEFKGRDLKKLTPLELATHLRGLSLARRLYYWFRLENMEGIPVYFRSTPENASLGETPPPIPEDPGVRNYIIPLVDATMVASPDWRAYVAHYAAKSSRQPDAAPLKRNSPATFRLLPVAVEPVAYNMPESMRKLNFLRHITPAGMVPEDAELIARITEVLCRDMRAWCHPSDKSLEKPANKRKAAAVPEKIKIFLSHAKADDTEEAITLKQYIQRETQCEAFFDETDIASGYDYTTILDTAVTRESAGLIVIQGDNYADRPWCRKEIRDFLRPVEDSCGAGKGRQYFVAPAVVVQTMKGKQIARTIPELGYSPCVRWQDAQSARFVITTLLREILFGLFYRRLAAKYAALQPGSRKVFLNRSPDPVMIARIMATPEMKSLAASPQPVSFIHPGYGLSNMEKDGLKASFPRYYFRSFNESSGKYKAPDLNLRGRIISISVGHSEEILNTGCWSEHTQEILLRFMRPLLRAQASLLYGGRLPESFRPAEPWKEELNFTASLLQLLLAERDVTTSTLQAPPRLYVPIRHHGGDQIDAQKIAQWTDICSFVKVPAKDWQVGAPFDDKTRPQPLTEVELAKMPESERERAKEARQQLAKAFEPARNAIALTIMRRRICGIGGNLTCKLPDPPLGSAGGNNQEIDTSAHLLMGGKTEGFTGWMPGLFEEALYAIKQNKPVFLISAAGGAAGMLAEWLLHPPAKQPPQLTVDHYIEHDPVYARMFAGITAADLQVACKAFCQDIMDALWERVESVRDATKLGELLKNGLTWEKNRELLEAKNTGRICQLVWEGMEKQP